MPRDEKEYFAKCKERLCFANENGKCVILNKVDYPCSFFKTRKQAKEDLRKHPYRPEKYTEQFAKVNTEWVRRLLKDD